MTLLEVLIATVVLMIGYLGWISTMLVATQAQNKSSEHAQAIAIADYLVETMRRDPYFWQSSELTASCTSGNCWNTNINPNPCNKTVKLPPYNDTFNIASAHRGFCAGNASYTYLWRADPHGAGTAFLDTNLADLTVWVIITIDGRQDVYKVVSENASL